ncbi:pimeloyl-ACP methyl ester carboxylesterase [Gelidibacter sediminis]|uniref:Pimeloyl-ACP methyl ester carboxylesterase n=1 Tax=Gelidibacter sediminis TaxID=1608710 RepID=A0A4R7Q8W0_9FLAO|nr:alpha/beta hydrolase [Gelidibacter sediminis]TDU43359.1 pimeloyl-ACP methyl ester carboxylesterase [Gelidibacter sediminis]
MILEYKDIPVFYQDYGHGTPVVLLHGFLETSLMWENLIPKLAENHQVITIDLLGHGGTGCLGYIHTMEMMANVVKFVMEHLHIEKSVVIGHSMGGYVALALADKYPDKVRKLCLMNSSPFADSPERQINRDRAIAAVKYNHKNFISMSIVNLFSPTTRERFGGEIETIKLIANALPIQGIIAALEGMKVRKDRSEVLKRLNPQNLVILGQKDPVLEYHIVRTELEKLKIKIIDFPDGHMSHIENNNELTYNLLQFVE